MPNTQQTFRLIALSLALWVLATLYIRLAPKAFLDPLQGALGFVAAPPAAWLSVWLVRRCGGLGQHQLMPGVAVVGAVAMMIDGLALRWLPGLYGSDDTIVRLGAAWLLWGYGVSLAVTLAMSRTPSPDFSPPQSGGEDEGCAVGWYGNWRT